jgi:hypothetical protein
MNWAVLIPFGILAIALIVLMTWRNLRDEKKFEKQLKDDYRKTRDSESDIEIDETMK